MMIVSILFVCNMYTVQSRSISIDKIKKVFMLPSFAYTQQHQQQQQPLIVLHVRNFDWNSYEGKLCIESDTIRRFLFS